ncbi:endolytic transglycosylase MltG [Motilimonas pumila]|uniref:Endolytic murein transglycosylase n=1 Tax=Motilimonas pumila TaxID=2303987 RepID=A0A418YCR0_9GAMM|nr:endolytic transglycosylase MltG [Motilimonas pumila]RJG42258.1 endolytic transglycosylase MltG [Motilimonas pumila]
MLKKIFLSFLFLCLLAAAAAYFAWQQFQDYRAAAIVNVEQVFKVPSGTHYGQLERMLTEAGMLQATPIYTPYFYKAVGKLRPELTRLKSGNFKLEAGWTLEQVLAHIVSGKEYQFKITFVEGSTYKQWQQQIESTTGVTVTGGLDDEAALAESLGLRQNKLEGFLQPQTYFFAYDIKDVDIVKRAFNAQKDYLKQAWAERDPELPLETPYEALILASIIEKETGHAPERDTISSVFVNRMRVGMRLQTDPTVIYGMGERYKGNITKKDLREKTPYNTYTIDGLPPTPIAMPGVDAIHAALHPADTKYFYFVSKGNGQHYFSKNLKEHNRAVRKYILKR